MFMLVERINVADVICQDFGVILFEFIIFNAAANSLVLSVLFNRC